MELVGILRLLGRHRLLAACGLVPALLVAVLLASRPETVVGTASARVLLDGQEQPTPRLEAAVNGSLGPRALLLADLLATEQSTDAIARAAGLEAEELAVLGPSSGAPPVAVPLALRATEAAALTPEPFRLVVSTDGVVPIVALRASGPDAGGAARVVDAAAGELEAVLAARAIAGEPATVRLERLGPALGATRVDRPEPALPVVAAIVVLLGWCGAIVVIEGIRRHRRRRRPTAAPSARVVSG